MQVLTFNFARQVKCVMEIVFIDLPFIWGPLYFVFDS